MFPAANDVIIDVSEKPNANRPRHATNGPLLCAQTASPNADRINLAAIQLLCRLLGPDRASGRDA